MLVPQSIRHHLNLSQGKEQTPMNGHIKFVMASVFAMLVSPAMNRLSAVDIYVAGLDPISNPIFGTIDSSTATFTSRGYAPNISSMTWSPSVNAFYINESGVLNTMNTSGIQGTSIGNLTSGPAERLAFNPATSTLYGIGSYVLTSINTSNGAETTLASTIELQSATFVGGSMYVTRNINGTGKFGTIDTTTGQFSQIGSDSAFYMFMNLASDGTTLYGIYNSFGNTNTLASLNTSTGALVSPTDIGGSNVSYFMAAGMITTSVPEPSAYALGAIATGILAAIARRRKACKA